MNIERFEARLRLLPCAVCVAIGRTPPNPCHELHHVGDPQTERDDRAQIPICDEHHEGPNGIHGMRRRPFFKQALAYLRC